MSFRDYLSEARSIFEKLYPDNQITEVDYEGPTIVVYTKNLDLFSHRDDLAKQIAQELRRRIAIRPDPSILDIHIWRSQRIHSGKTLAINYFNWD